MIATIRHAAVALAVAALAGAVCGVVVGGGLGRIAMRIAGAMSPEAVGTTTAAGNVVGAITVEGTLALATFVGLASGLFGGVLYAVVAPWMGPFGERLRGLVFGVFLLLVFGVTVLDPANADFTRFGSAPLNAALFALLFVIFGIAIVWAHQRVGIAVRGGSVLTWPLRILAAILVVPALLLTVVLVNAPTGLGDPLFSAALVVGLAGPHVVRWRRLPERLAYAALAVPAVAGGWRVLSGLPYLLQ